MSTELLFLRGRSPPWPCEVAASVQSGTETSTIWWTRPHSSFDTVTFCRKLQSEPADERTSPKNEDGQTTELISNRAAELLSYLHFSLQKTNAGHTYTRFNDPYSWRSEELYSVLLCHLPPPAFLCCPW